jgi:hypothetical protein
MALAMPLNADLRALWDERYGDDRPVARPEPSSAYDYLIAFGLTVSGLAMGAASLTI